MPTSKIIPVALTIAGSDSGGGAGIQADLKTFAALGLHGTSVITCVTAQGPKRVLAVQPCAPKLVGQQLEAVFEQIPPQAIKVGMLYTAEIIRQVAKFLTAVKPKLPLVVDPVLAASSGKPLLEKPALRELRRRLFPLASLITPNIPETQILTGAKIAGPEEMRSAARQLHQEFGCAVLVKGGHLQGFREAADLFYDGHTELLLTTPRVKQGHAIHGTGCTYSAAIAGYAAKGLLLPNAVMKAKEYMTASIRFQLRAGKSPILNHFWAA